MAEPRSLQQWLDWQLSLHPTEIELGLERVGEVHARLGHGRPAPLVITVAGTNGKGSCVAMLAAILTAQGLRVGSYTSPHIAKYNERIQLAGKYVEDDALVAAFEQVDEARAQTPLTFFEFGTLAAIVLLAEANVEVALLEVGLGGRLDAVNIVDADAALITGIDYDHQDWLGDTLEEIAGEKAGVMRAGKPVVFGSSRRPRSIDAVAARVGATLLACERDYQFSIEPAGWVWQNRVMRLTKLPMPALPGRHQVQNAAACLALLDQLPSPWKPGRPAIDEGLGKAKLPGRLQQVSHSPAVIVDVAHNLQSCAALGAYLEEQRCEGRTLAVFGALRDKNPATLVAKLHGQVDQWYVAQTVSPRAMSSDNLEAAVREVTGPGFCSRFDTITQAFAAAMKIAEPKDRIVVFGSFFTVEEVLTSIS